MASQKQNQNRRGASSVSSSVTIITPDCHFNGRLFCRGSSRVGGRIEGEVVSEGVLVIEEGALITAEIKADEVVIQGTVKGKLFATGRVELSATAKFEGDICSPCLVINEGAQFNGTSSMMDAATAAKGNSPGVENIQKNHGKNSNDKFPDIGIAN